MTEPLLAVDDLVIGYDRPLIRPLSFRVDASQIRVLVTGRNGAGKSTLLDTLALGMAPLAGAIRIDGDPRRPCSRAAARRLGIVRGNQRARVVDSLNARENIQLALRATAGDYLRSVLGIDPNADTRGPDAMLERLGYPDLGSVAGSELSTGQRRVVDNARVLMADHARLLLFDEPLANLHASAVAPFVEALRAVTEATGSGAVIIEHRRIGDIAPDSHVDLDNYSLSRSAASN